MLKTFLIFFLAFNSYAELKYVDHYQFKQEITNEEIIHNQMKKCMRVQFENLMERFLQKLGAANISIERDDSYEINVISHDYTKTLRIDGPGTLGIGGYKGQKGFFSVGNHQCEAIISGNVFHIQGGKSCWEDLGLFNTTYYFDLPSLHISLYPGYQVKKDPLGSKEMVFESAQEMGFGFYTGYESPGNIPKGDYENNRVYVTIPSGESIENRNREIYIEPKTYFQCLKNQL